MRGAKTANQKGKGAAGAREDQFFALAAFIYPCLFALQVVVSRLPFLSCAAFFASFPFLREGRCFSSLFDGISNWGWFDHAHHELSIARCGWHREGISWAVFALMRSEADAKTVIPRSGMQKTHSRCARHNLESMGWVGLSALAREANSTKGYEYFAERVGAGAASLAPKAPPIK